MKSNPLPWVLFILLIAPSSLADTLSPIPAPGEDESAEKTPLLDEVVVTATRSRRSLSGIPASVSVISRSTLEAAPALNTDDLLRSQAGVDVKRVTGMASGIPSRISVRGVPGINRTLLLLDGIPLNAAGTGFLGTNEAPLDLAERIEVVRGPFSSLYGSNAFGGVVNVITRDPGVGLDGDFTTTAGAFGHREYSGFVSGSGSKASLLFHADTRSTDNYLVRDYRIDRTWDAPTGSFRINRLPVENYDTKEERTFAKASFDPFPDTRVSILGHTFHGRTGYGQTVFLQDPRENTLENRTRMGALRFEASPSPLLDLTIGGYGRRRNEHIVNESYSHMNPFPPFPVYVPSYSDTEYTDWQGELRAVWHPTENHALTLGGEHLRNEGRFDPTRRIDDNTPIAGRNGRIESIRNTAFYLQEEWSAGAFRMVPGARLDRVDSLGSVVSPKAGLLCRVSDRLRLRTSVGRAFRAPTLSELYMPDISSIPGVVLKSNPGLRPEYLTSADFGATWDAASRFKAGLDVFHNDMKDLISTRKEGPTMTYVNVDRARSQGFDSVVSWIPAPGWRFSANHTYQWAVDRNNGAVLDYMPQNKGSVSLGHTRSLGSFTLDLHAEEFLSGSRFYTDSATRRRVRLDPYACTGAGLKVRWLDRASLSIRALNLFDREYEETGEVLSPGRQVLVSASAGF